MHRAIVQLGFLLFLLWTGCDLPGRPTSADRSTEDQAGDEFEPLYTKHCAACHGADGRMGPGPPLNDPLFLEIVSEQTLRETIENGRRDTPMPAFGKAQGGELTDQQIATFVKGMKSLWKGETTPHDNIPSYQPATEREKHESNKTEVLKRGEKAFRRACAGCHGPHGEGKENGQLQINRPAFLKLMSDQVIRRYVITGRADLGMPNFAQIQGRSPDYIPLTSQEITDIVSLMSAWRSSSLSTEATTARQKSE